VNESFLTPTPLILVGDSILQNQAYVSRGNSVYDLVVKEHPNTICYATDDSRIIDVYGQIEKIQQKQENKDGSLLFLSIGGNDLYHQSLKGSLQDTLTIKYKTLVEWIQKSLYSKKPTYKV
jgi:hypothetical protein